MDVIPAKAGISPLLKHPVTKSGGVFFIFIFCDKLPQD